MIDKKYVIGIDIGGSSIKISPVDYSGAFEPPRIVKSGPSGSSDLLIDSIVGKITEISNQIGAKPDRIGMGSAGAIDIRHGSVISSPNFPAWKNLPLAKLVEERSGVEAIVDNDANCAAIGESWLGCAADMANFIFFTLGTGVGGAIVLDQKLWRGTDGMAGELGHIVVEQDGRMCGCGRLGCVERYASATGIKQSARERFAIHATDNVRKKTGDDKSNLGGKMLTDLAFAGDRFAKSVFADAGHYLGKAIGQLVLTLDITNVVIGGGLSPAFDLMKKNMETSAKNSAYTLADREINIVCAKLGNSAGFLGAGRLAIDSA